jgi:hypothetical protein
MHGVRRIWGERTHDEALRAGVPQTAIEKQSSRTTFTTALASVARQGSGLELPVADRLAERVPGLRLAQALAERAELIDLEVTQRRSGNAKI